MRRPPLWQLPSFSRKVASPGQKVEQHPCLSSGCLCAGAGAATSPVPAHRALVTLATCLTSCYPLNTQQGEHDDQSRKKDTDSGR